MIVSTLQVIASFHWHFLGSLRLIEFFGDVEIWHLIASRETYLARATKERRERRKKKTRWRDYRSFYTWPCPYLPSWSRGSTRAGITGRCMAISTLHMTWDRKYKQESGRERHDKEDYWRNKAQYLPVDFTCLRWKVRVYLSRIYESLLDEPHEISTYIHIQFNSLPCVTVPHALSGALTAFAISSSRIACATSTAAIAVISPLSSYAGATSTTSPPMMFKPSSPARMVSSSRVLQPPGSGVPVAIHPKSLHQQSESTVGIHIPGKWKGLPGANAKSNTSMSTLI